MPTILAPSPVSPLRRPRRRAVIVLIALAAVAAAMLAVVLARGAFASTAHLPTPFFAPTADDGLIRGDDEVTLEDDVPAISKLDAALRDAMRTAEADAATDGVRFLITSGWRSGAYQRWLLDDAIRFYGNEETARQYVASPEVSQHVTGRAVDVGPVDAQFWLIEHGTAYGICQTYANERWHFELATAPGGVCPEMKVDAAS